MLSHSKALAPESTHKDLDITQVIGDVASNIALLTAKGFNEDSKTAIVDSLLGVISSITKYSRHMELEIELGTSREHEAIRLLEKFKKIAKQQKTVIDAMSEEERRRSAIQTTAVDTNTSLTGVDMIAQEDELTREISVLRDRLTRRTDECRKLGLALKRSDKSEKKLRRIVQRSHEIMQAQEALMQGNDRAMDQYTYDAEEEQHYNDSHSRQANENQLYVSADSESLEESTATVDYEYSNNGARRGPSAGFPPPVKSELPLSDPSQEQSQHSSSRLNDGGTNEESYGVYSQAKARTRMDERKMFEMTEAEVGAEYHYHEPSPLSRRYADATLPPEEEAEQEQGGGESEGHSPVEGESSQAPPDLDVPPVVSSPPRAVVSTSPTPSPRRSPLRSSASSKSPKSPKEAIFNFVEEAAQQEDSELDLSFVAAKDERSRENSPEKALSLFNESVRSDSNNDRDVSVSTLRSSPERSIKSPSGTSSPFEEIDSLEDSFSMIQKYY